MSIIGDSIFITAGRTRAPIRVDIAALQYSDTGLKMSPHDRTVTAASVELSGKVYCFGGEGVNRTGNHVGFRRDSEYYDTATDTWTVIPKLLLAREFSAAVALNGKLYVLGGRVRGHLETDRVEVYTP